MREPSLSHGFARMTSQKNSHSSHAYGMLKSWERSGVVSSFAVQRPKEGGLSRSPNDCEERWEEATQQGWGVVMWGMKEGEAAREVSALEFKKAHKN